MCFDADFRRAWDDTVVPCLTAQPSLVDCLVLGFFREELPIAHRVGADGGGGEPPGAVVSLGGPREGLVLASSSSSPSFDLVTVDSFFGRWINRAL